MLYEKASKLEMLEDVSFSCYTGKLFDKIKIKEDLVYDKNTRELIGYCDIDSVGNQLLELDRKTSTSHLNWPYACCHDERCCHCS